MRRRTHNYSRDGSTQENLNDDGKYEISGESEWTRDLTVPFDQNEILSERHFVLGNDLYEWERELKAQEGEDYTGRGPRDYRRSDNRIYEEVCESLWRSPKVDATEIEVKVEHGVVNLRGVVHHRQFKREAEALVEQVPGVVDVMNEIQVQKNPQGLIQNTTGLI